MWLQVFLCMVITTASQMEGIWSYIKANIIKKKKNIGVLPKKKKNPMS